MKQIIEDQTKKCPYPRTISGLIKRYGDNFSHEGTFACLAILDVPNGHCLGTPVLLTGCRSGNRIILSAECVCGNFHTSGFKEVEDVKAEWIRMCEKFGEEPGGKKWIADHRQDIQRKEEEHHEEQSPAIFGYPG